MDWPVVPEVTETAREIYRKGIAMGNNPHAFSKVGDCQNVKQAFLGFFDHPGKYKDMKGIGSMQDTINNFQGYFDRDGEATQVWLQRGGGSFAVVDRPGRVPSG